MVRNQKATGRAVSMPSGLAAGVSFSIVLTLLALGVLAKMIDTEMVAWESAGYVIMVTLIMAAALGTALACHKIKRRILMVSILNGLLYFGILLSVSALFFGGQYEGTGVTAILILGSSLATGVLKLRKGEGKRGNTKRLQHR